LLSTAHCSAKLRARLQARLPDGLKDALFVLERLRARKTPEELRLLRKASELVVDTMATASPDVAPAPASRSCVTR
jgi:Xaa-Pro aminopeptidase